MDDAGVAIDYKGENRCPRHHIYEDPFWWDQIISAYNAKQDGILPHAGGLSEQPALYISIMSVIGSAIEDERELEDEKKEKRDAMLAKSKGQMDGTDISNISEGKGYRYMTDPVKGKQ